MIIKLHDIVQVHIDSYYEYNVPYVVLDYTEDNVALMTMKDGMIIEICDWHDGDIYVRDFSV